jgi:hypothetical protein
MFEKNVESQILPFFYSNGDLNNTALNYIYFRSHDGYHVYALASLYSAHIKDLEKYHSEGLRQLKQRFNSVELPILDRMKATIFQSGDFLANHLTEAREEVDDVDFSVCLIACKDGILYVWIDGELNVRIYRGQESILVNSDKKLQFNGSTNVELGDILAVSYTKNIEDHDDQVEDYVLEKQVPGYSSLFLDYQVDTNENLAVATDSLESFETDEVSGADDVFQQPLSRQINDAESPDKKTSQFAKPNLSELSLKVGSLRGDAVRQFSHLKNSEAAQNAGMYVKKGLSFILNILMAVTSKIIDLFYSLVLRKNQHQIKRFQNSYQKKNIQYLMIFMIVVFAAYVLFFKGGESQTNTTANGSAAGKSQQETRTTIQTDFDKLTTYYNSVQIPNFTQTFGELKQKVSAAKASGFTDTAYLDTVLVQAQSFEDTLFKVTPISKVDEVYFATTIANAKIVDFAVLGNEIYAIDRGNSQILKSNGVQQFEVFASDPRLTSMNQITCVEGNCYILDDARGLAVLSIAKKTFEVYPNSAEVSTGVREMLYAFNRIYTLVPAESKVMKYDQQDQGFKPGEQWNTDAGFGPTVQDFAIDSNVFELANGGVLRKFYRNKYDPSFLGMQESNAALGNRLQLAMTPARNPGPNVRNRLYVADSVNQLIAVFDKDINSAKQFSFLGVYKYRGTEKITFEGMDEAVLSDDEQFLYLMGNNMVFKVRVTAL